MQTSPQQTQILQAALNVQYEDFCLSLDISVPLNGVVAIYGKSGSGKTTFLRSIAGLEKDAYGTIKFGSTLWQDKNTFVKTYQRAIGYVFQDAGLLSHLSVRKNLEYGKKRANNPLAESQSIEIIQLLGLEKLLESSVDNLSGGEKQRVAIARALLIRPTLLLLDEPLASLDTENKSKILSYLEQLKQSSLQPMLYVSHSASEISRIADYVVVMDDGRVSYHGSIKDIAARKDSPFSRDSQPFSVLFGTIIEACNPYQLSVVDVQGFQFKMPTQEVTLGQSIRLHIEAKDVSIVLSNPSDSSIINIFEVTVLSVEDSPLHGQCLVKLRLGTNDLLAHISLYSYEHLAIKTGQKVFAQIKALSIVQ